MCAESEGQRPLIANRQKAGEWETFDLIVLHGDTVALKSHANGRYICAENGALIANRLEIGAHETFRMTNLGTGKIALTAANGKFVCAENNGNADLIANRSAIGAWETFDLIGK